MTFHHLSFRAFCQATEDQAKVRRALLFASGADEEEVEVMRCEGYHGNQILRMEVCLRSAKRIRGVFQRMSREDLRALLGSVEPRVDQECALHFRLDKQEACLGRMHLGERAEGDDVIAVQGKVKSYPRNRGTALENARRFLEAELGSGRSP